MKSYTTVSDTILDAYSVCTKIYFGLSKSPKREDLETLENALDTIDANIQILLEMLHEDGLTWKDSWTLSKWLEEDYLQKNGQYTCPSEILEKARSAVENLKMDSSE